MIAPARILIILQTPICRDQASVISPDPWAQSLILRKALSSPASQDCLCRAGSFSASSSHASAFPRSHAFCRHAFASAGFHFDTEGKGPTPKPTDTVKVHYAGTLVDGKEFDSSIKRGQPISFPLNQVIPCWTEGVQKMKVGGKAKLVCPSAIAYGDSGRPPVIPGGATLVFEIELLGIEK